MVMELNLLQTLIRIGVFEMTLLEQLLEERNKTQEAIDNVLEAGQEFQTRTGRVKQVPLESLRRQLADINNRIADLQQTDYTDTECFVYRGCR